MISKINSSSASDRFSYSKKINFGMNPYRLILCHSNLAQQTILLISNKEMDDIIKIAKSLKNSGLLINGVNKSIKMKQNNKKVHLLAFY